MPLNKKIGIIAILFILITISLVSAQTESLEKKIVSGVDQTQKNIDSLKNIDETSGEFLAKEWTAVLRNNKAFSWIYKLDPIFKFFIGQEFSISWKFITGLLIWLIVLFAILGSLDAVFDNKIFNLSFGIIMSALTSQLAVPYFIDQATKILKKGTEKTAIWINLTNIIILICLLILAHKLTKLLKKKIEQNRFKKRIIRAEEATKTIDKATTKAESLAKGMEEEMLKEHG